MLKRMALTMFGLALAGCAPALSMDLICAGESGAVMVIGSDEAYRLTLAESGRQLELERWGVCFRCAGFPNLQLDLVEPEAAGAKAWVGTDVRRCDGAVARSIPQEYCVRSASVRIGTEPSRRCSFPEGTTLEHLWTALTQTPPPDNIDSWWVFPGR